MVFDNYIALKLDPILNSLIYKGSRSNRNKFVRLKLAEAVSGIATTSAVTQTTVITGDSGDDFFAQFTHS
jgi:hypothetical protein